MSDAAGLPVLNESDLNGVPFTVVACHNCKSSCNKESPVIYQGEKSVVCAERYLKEVMGREKPKRKGPPTFVIIPFVAAILFFVVAYAVVMLR